MEEQKKIREVLLLKSPANTGKTESINYLHDKFTAKYGLKKKKKVNESRRDFEEVYEANGYVVGFASEGDEVGKVEENFKFFNGENPKGKKCDIGITACRTKGKTVEKTFELIEKYECELSLFGPIEPPSNDEGTEAMAAMMLDRLIQLLEGKKE